MKITITIEDDGDAVKVVADPTFAQLMTAIAERSPTAAECYALAALNRIRDVAKEAAAGQSVVQVPMSNPPKELKLVSEKKTL